MLIATKSSPLYPFNDWVDTNASFTMGKAMINGQVLYRDIFDQRGPLLYFFYGLAYLISKTSFLGVYIFEVLAFSIFLFFSYKILLLFIDNRYALISLPILAAIVLNLNSFTHGGSPEELCLPLVSIGLYHILAYFKTIYPKLMPYKWVLINGLIAGCVLWIKFSLLGFWFGWMLSLFIVLLINCGIIRAIKAAFIFLSGMLLSTLPWVIYFGVNQSINVWINSYFVINLTSYSTTTSIISIIKSVVVGLLNLIRIDILPISILYFGLIIFVVYDNFFELLIKRVSLLSCFSFLVLSVFGGGRLYIYYLLIFSPFIVFGLIVISNIIYNKFGEIKSRKMFLTICAYLSLLLIIYTYTFHHNSYMRKLEKDDLVQYQFATIINQTEDPTLLNYGVLDLGFFTTTGIIPNIRFFQQQNIPYASFPLVRDEQDRYIKEQVVDYVVTLTSLSGCNEKLSIPYFYENYSLIKKNLQRNEGTVYCFFLFGKKDLSD